VTLEPEVVEREQPEENSWLPSNFANPEALVKSFRELQAHATQISQQNAELRDTLEAWMAEADEPAPEPREDEPRRPRTRDADLQRLQRLAEASSYAGAKRVVQAVESGRVEAPEDPATLARVTSEIMPTRDPRWAETSPDLIAQIIGERPGLLADMSDMNAVIGGLSTAAELARGRQAEQTLFAWQRAEATRQEKLSAQSLSGVGGRIETDDEADFFERLKAAHGQTYAAARNS
jgi:hypothetical protein